MTLGIECLITDDEARAANCADALDKLNRDRRKIEAGMLEQAVQHLKARLRVGLDRSSTPTGTRAWSASSPRASRTGCTCR